MGWLNLIDGILIILLVATICCAVSLSRRLSSLRSDKKNLEKLMSEFHDISEKADKSLTGIRATAEEVSRELAEANAKSRSMRDELAFLVERADRLAEKIAADQIQKICLLERRQTTNRWITNNLMTQRSRLVMLILTTMDNHRLNASYWVL